MQYINDMIGADGSGMLNLAKDKNGKLIDSTPIQAIDNVKGVAQTLYQLGITQNKDKDYYKKLIANAMAK